MTNHRTENELIQLLQSSERENNHLKVKLGLAEERIDQLLAHRDSSLKEIQRLKDDMLCAMTVAQENSDRFAVVDMSAKIDEKLLGMSVIPKGMASPEDHRKMTERIFDLERKNQTYEARNVQLEHTINALTAEIGRLKEPLIVAITVAREQERKGQ